jgi:uncharacterized membrane protein YfcA
MDLLLLTGYAGALVVGAVLGVLGGGGSILTIPLLVYLFDLPPLEATGYSLFIVGVSSLAGVAGSIRRGWLNYRVAFVFVAPSLLAVYLTRHYLLPSLPQTFLIQGGPRTSLLFLLLAVTVLAFWLLRHARWKRPGIHRALLLAVPAAIAVYVMRRAVLPSLPAEGFMLAGFEISRDLALMLLLAIVMLVTGAAMLRGRARPDDDLHEATGAPDAAESPSRGPDNSIPNRYAGFILGVQGLGVGALTGLIGAGGGFLITPALILLARLPVRHAVGTSLLIIAINSLTGFLGDLHRATPDWSLLLTLTALALAGVTFGSAMAARVPATHLRRALGILLTVMAVFILIAELG